MYGTTRKQDGSWSEAVLHSFTGGLDGGNPTAVLVLDAQGNLYGNTRNGGADGSGTVFKLTPNQDGSWSETVLYSFTGGADGESPRGTLLRDAQGNLYGDTKSGGDYGYGTLFKLDTTDQETVLYSFTGGTDGNWPGNFVRDAQGNLYGTAQLGGDLACNPPNGCGTSFKLTPNPDGTWSETVLHSFTGTGGDGVTPDGLVQDAFGNLYGTTGGGGAYGRGTVFELQLPPTLTVSIIGTGTVASTDGFIHCPGTCSHTYPPGTPVTLNATPGQGWVFGGWNGPCLGTGSCTLTMTQSLSVDAIFSQAQQFVPVTPCRLYDTRPQYGGSGPIPGGTFETFNLPQLAQSKGCADLSSAVAYSLHVDR